MPRTIKDDTEKTKKDNEKDNKDDAYSDDSYDAVDDIGSVNGEDIEGSDIGDVEEGDDGEIGSEEVADDDQGDEINIEEKYDDGGDCLYKDVKVDTEEMDDIPEEFDLFEDEVKKTVYIDDDRRITTKYLLKYEFTRLLGDRTKMLETGAMPLVEYNKDFSLSAREVAMLELKHGRSPFIIERPLPDGVVERWKVNELILLDYDN